MLIKTENCSEPLNMLHAMHDVMYSKTKLLKDLMIFICQLRSEEVLLKFNTDFHSRYNGEDYNVEFTFNRCVQINTRLCLCAFTQDRLLLPYHSQSSVFCSGIKSKSIPQPNITGSRLQSTMFMQLQFQQS